MENEGKVGVKFLPLGIDKKVIKLRESRETNVMVMRKHPPRSVAFKYTPEGNAITLIHLMETIE